MPAMTSYIKKFSEININDIPEVGGKNASLGEMFNSLQHEGIAVPDGFATTAAAFWSFLDENKLRPKLNELLSTLDVETFANLREIGARARSLLVKATLPDAIKEAILTEYRNLSKIST